MKQFLFFTGFLFLISCQESVPLLEIPNSASLIPEGIAINGNTGKIYLSSIHQRKIVEYDPEQQVTRDFISNGQYGYKRGIGIEIKDNRLFALGSEEEEGKGSSILLVFDLATDALLHSFQLPDSLDHFMNDLAITANDQIYITDTKRHTVYQLNYPNGVIEEFMKNKQIQHPNGIAVTEDGRLLFVDSWTEGIRIVDVATKKILNPSHAETTELGVDGLKYWDGKLLAMTNGSKDKSRHGLIEITVDAKSNELKNARPVLINHPKMNIPTTFSINDGKLSILANSQLSNLDQEKNEIIDQAILTNTFIIRRTLPKE